MVGQDWLFIYPVDSMLIDTFGSASSRFPGGTALDVVYKNR